MKFCGGCAARLETELRRDGPASNRSSTISTRVQTAERRQLTVLFCDVVGSTRHSANMDPEAWRAVLHAYHDLCDQIVGPLEGYVAQYLGDGVLVYFSYPKALEDAPRRAIRTGLELVRTIPAKRIEVDSPNQRRITVQLDVRVGIHTGFVVVDNFGGSNPQRLAVGDTLNLAARIQAVARPNNVVISDATYRLVEGFFETDPLGSHALDGFAEPVVLHHVLRETRARNRLDVAAASPGGITPFVGRDREIGALVDRWTEAKKGHGPVVLLSGEAGIGKSRHVRVLQERLASEPHTIIECHCSPDFQSTALYPVVEMLEHNLGIASEPSNEGKLKRIEAALNRSSRSAADGVPLIASLLSVPLGDRYLGPELLPQKQRQATFELLVTWLFDLAKERPTLFVVEDLHWADPSTLEFLGLLVQREPPGRLLLLLTHRPEFRSPFQHPTRLSELSLHRLPRGETEAIVRHVAAGRGLSPTVVHNLMAKADGVPLFVEEITKAVLESDLVKRGDEPDPRGSLPHPEHIPATLHDSLMARLDRLGTSKRIAQLAATLGREFRYAILHAVSGEHHDVLRRDLGRLVEAELIFQQAQAPEETYLFKHALIQDAAYQSLLHSARQEYHKDIARVLTERFPDFADQKPELLARHFEGAGAVGDAVRLWGLAGQRAIARSAFAEAIAAFGRAIEQLKVLPESTTRDFAEIELRSGLGLALISTTGFSSKEVEATYTAARELCERYGDVPVRVLYGNWVFQVVRGNREATARLADIFGRSLDGAPEPLAALVAHSCLTVRNFWMGNFRPARDHAARGQAIAERWTDPRNEVERLLREYAYEGPLYCVMHLAWCDLYAGQVEQCRASVQRGLELAAIIEQPYVTAMAYAFACSIARDMQDPERAIPLAEKAIAVATESGFPFWLAAGLFTLGWAISRSGDREAGLGYLKQGFALYKQMGVLVSLPYYTSYLAEWYLEAGRYAEGLATVDEMLELGSTNVGCGFEPELLRLKGELLLGQGNASGAEVYFRRALAGTRQQGAKLFEVRAALSLGRLLVQRKERGEARAELSATCESLPAEFETIDVTRARALLAELV